VRRFFAFPLVRFVLIVVVSVVLLGLAFLIAQALGASPFRPPATAPLWMTVVMNWVGAFAVLAALLLVERIAAGRSARQIGLDPHSAIRDVFLGVAFGAALFSIVILILALSGDYHVRATHFTSDLGIAVLLFGAGAAFEELLFRGVVFRLIEEWAGTWIALLVSAVFFGLAHAANPGSTWVSSLAIALEAGVLLAAAYVATRNLWLPIGLHFAWNFCEGPVYGAHISGVAFPLKDALSARIEGPAAFTGGAFGPEAGIPAILVGLGAALALLVYAQRRALFVRPRWLCERVMQPSI
jgi:membrane protease YdiL (CAAX protease family)